MANKSAYITSAGVALLICVFAVFVIASTSATKVSRKANTEQVSKSPEAASQQESLDQAEGRYLGYGGYGGYGGGFGGGFGGYGGYGGGRGFGGYGGYGGYGGGGFGRGGFGHGGFYG